MDASELTQLNKICVLQCAARCPPKIEEGPGISVTGTICAPMISNTGVLDIIPGVGIQSTGGQTPTISNDGVLTLNGLNGVVGVTAGAGINVITVGSNIQISNTGGGPSDPIAIGTLAGNTGQTLKAIAIGVEAGETNQQAGAVALGWQAGEGTQATQAIAIGQQAGQTTQQTQAIAIGYQAGQSSQQAQAIAIGLNAGVTNQQTRSIAIGHTAGSSSQQSFGIAIGSSAGATNQGSNTVAIGTNAGSNSQVAGAVAIGSSAGITSQASNAVAIGFQAGQTSQASNAVAIGPQAGQTSQQTGAIAIGSEAGRNNLKQNSVAIGNNAAGDSLTNATEGVFIGREAGRYTSGTGSVCIGSFTGVGTIPAGGIGQFSTALGPSAARYASTGTEYGVFIGYQAGMGTATANPDKPLSNSIAIGRDAGLVNLGTSSIAIGYSAASAPAAVYNNTIVLNATGAAVNPTQASSLYVAPIRQVTSLNTLMYDPTSREVTYTPPLYGEMTQSATTFDSSALSSTGSGAGGTPGAWVDISDAQISAGFLSTATFGGSAITIPARTPATGNIVYRFITTIGCGKLGTGTSAIDIGISVNGADPVVGKYTRVGFNSTDGVYGFSTTPRELSITGLLSLDASASHRISLKARQVTVSTVGATTVIRFYSLNFHLSSTV